MFPAGRKHGKKTRAARSRTREKPSCRKILTLCKVPERGAPTPLPKQRAARGRAALTRAGTKAASDELRSGNCPASTPEKAPDVRSLSRRSRRRADVESPRKTAAGQRFSGERRRCRCREAAKKNARTPGCCNDARFLPERARPGANGRRARTFSPAAPRREKFPKTRGRGVPGRLRLREKYRRRGSAARPCPCVRARKPNAPAPKGAATHGERLPNAGQKKSDRTPPPATESGRAPSVKTTQMRTT